MTEAAVSILVVLALILGVAGLLILRPDPAKVKAEQAQSADERRLASTSDPVRRDKLMRRMENRMKGQ